MSYDPCVHCGKMAIKTGSKGEWLCYRCAMGTVDPIVGYGRTGRNWPCPCGSDKKYKHCCLQVDEVMQGFRVVGVEGRETQIVQCQDKGGAWIDMVYCKDEESARKHLQKRRERIKESLSMTPDELMGRILR
jgi:hypothetical protein